MIFRSHRPDRDSTPCFSLEQASMSKSQHGLVGAELNEDQKQSTSMADSGAGAQPYRETQATSKIFL